ncbi:MAG: S9 family peptidase [Planctomycetes bacterium]|nr:S9 family peptidase [Planctomycetota bacterium]
MRRASLLLTLLAASLTCACAAVQPHAADRASALEARIDRIFKTDEYAAPRFGPARWLPGGEAYAIVERSAAGAQIVRCEAATGARSVLVAASRLVPTGQTTGLDIQDYAWSADEKRLLVFTNTRKVWRDHTRGDYWVLELESGRLAKLGGDAPEASLMFAKFSPDGTRAAYVRANDIYVERLSDGALTRLTQDGSETTINGTSDWVYEEELGVRDAFLWSPDGERIAYWQFDTTGVGVFSLVNDTDTLYPLVTRIPYPKVGTQNSAVRIGVVDAAGGQTRWMRTPGDPRDSYLARLSWIDAGTLEIGQLNRLQNQHDVLLAEAGTGEVRRVLRDESRTWVDIGDVLGIEGGKSFLFESERDGWRHLYRVPREGGEPTLLTRLDADVLDGVAGVDEKQGLLYFRASPDDATQAYLYRAQLDGSGHPERVTPDDQPGSHEYTLAPGARLAFHTRSRFDQPGALDVVTLPEHRSLRQLTDTATLEAKLAPILQPPVEFLKLDIGDGVSLDGWLLKPADFDATKRYPLIVFVYGEPAAVTVTDRWGGGRMLFHRALCEAGYLVASFDNRGTPAPKGAAWRKAVYGTVGELSSKEQAAAVRTLAAERPYVDRARVGVWGWSGGGSNTLNCMFRYPDVFAVGVSVAPVPDQRLYDTIYQERYMGLPDENAIGYRVGSPIHFAKGLAGRLLIVHGSGDDNVHYQGTERLVNRLVELGKSFDTMVYPNRTHAIAEGPGTRPHVYQLIARYFLEHLPAGPR